MNSLNQAATLREEQLQDSDLKLYFDYLEQGLVPKDEKIARRMAAEKSLYEIVDGVSLPRGERWDTEIDTPLPVTEATDNGSTWWCLGLSTLCSVNLLNNG